MVRLKCKCQIERTDGLEPCGQGRRDQRPDGIYCECGHDSNCCITAMCLCGQFRECPIHDRDPDERPAPH